MESDDPDRFDLPSLDLLKRAVARAQVNPDFARRFVEEAGLLVKGDRALRQAFDEAAARLGGPVPTFSRHVMQLLIDTFDLFVAEGLARLAQDKSLEPPERLRLAHDEALERVKRIWPLGDRKELDLEYIRSRMASFRRAIADRGD